VPWIKDAIQSAVWGVKRLFLVIPFSSFISGNGFIRFNFLTSPNYSETGSTYMDLVCISATIARDELVAAVNHHPNIA